jgi:ABC-type Zn uptake system ZnuABC Zn-binding protein ZnuA
LNSERVKRFHLQREIFRKTLWIGGLLAAILSGCGPGTASNPAQAGQASGLAAIQPAALTGGEKLRVVATTAILGDVVRNVGGDTIDLTILIGPGQDPHAYEPTPRDVVAMEKAQVVFENGLGLEAGLDTTIRAAASHGQPVVEVSAGAKILGNSTAAPAAGKQVTAGNPHVWLDPTNVKIWLHNIETTLGALDPQNAAVYRANVATYAQKLADLDGYIQDQVAKIPIERRKLVTDHEALEYFAARYGFTIVGTVIPSYSTIAEPSAANLTDLINKIRAEKVPAVFVGTTANPKVAEVVANETAAKVLPLYSESLGAPGSGADTYLGMMRTDVDRIVQGLS